MGFGLFRRERHGSLPAVNAFGWEVEPALYPAESEVVQSRFLAWLLDEDAEHGQGPLIAEALLDAVGVEVSPEDLDGYEVATERHGGEAVTDIVMSREGRFLVYIEHKVDASEQPDQIDREFRDMRKAAERMGVPVERQSAVFLTPTGRPPRSGDPSRWLLLSHSQLADRFAALTESVSDPYVRQLVDDWVAVTRNWRGTCKMGPFTEQSRFYLANYDRFRDLCGWAADLADQLTGTLFATASEFLVEGWERDQPGSRTWFEITRPEWRTSSGVSTLLLGCVRFSPEGLMGRGGWPFCSLYCRYGEEVRRDVPTIDEFRRRLAAELEGRPDLPGAPPNRRGYIRTAELPRCTSGDLDEYARELTAFTHHFFRQCIAVLEELDAVISEHLKA